MDFQLCTGAIYILLRVIGYIMKDHRVEEEFLWKEKSEMMSSSSTKSVIIAPLAIKLAEATMRLLFKPGYTTRDSGVSNKQ